MRPLRPVLLGLACCVVAVPLATADSGRLSRDVVPTAESVRLVVDAAKPGYTGTVRIDLRVNAATDSFQLNARKLRIETASLSGKGAAIPVTGAGALNERVTFRAAAPLAPGDYTLEIGFSNDFNTRAVSLYRLETGGEAYTFTQFEADDAREAFPCWDEPEFKIPWRLTLVVPERHLAISNTPVERETASGGQKTVEFRQTRPLPSYLLAIATGPLDTVSVPGMSVPARIVAVKGAGAMTAEAVRMTPPILSALEKYFGRPYPYEKLDQIAVPEFWPGAMENAGAVTFADRILLMDPRAVSVQQRRRLAEVMAHELSHMWFGDLVTMKWWDDLWLNESFASWLGDKITNQVYPEFNIPVRELEGRERAYTTDARLSTRAIRQPVTASINLNQLADELAYQKGEAVLGMFERWIGPETFRKGVIEYLGAHEWGSTEASDLWQALSKAAGKDVGSAMATFLDQPGVPLVSAEPLAGGRVRLRQRRFLNYGTPGPPPTLWQIPVTLRFSDGKKTYTQSLLLTDSVRTVTLHPAVRPTWLHPDAGERGYYRWSLPSERLQTLAAGASRTLDSRERVGYVGNLAALLDAGAVHGDEFLQVLNHFAEDRDPDVVAAVAGGLFQVKFAFVTPELSDRFASYVRKTLGPALARVGVEPRPGEPPSITSLRPTLLGWLGDDGRDPTVLAWARKAATAYLADPSTLDPSLVEAMLRLAAIQSDAALYDTCRARFESTRSPIDRSRYLTALSFFRDSALVERTLRYALEGPLRPQELRTATFGIASYPPYQDRLYAWVEKNYAKIASRIPPEQVAFMPFYASGCSAQRLEAARVFFSQPEHSAMGTEKTLAKVTDQVGDCIGLREREGAAVADYLLEFAAQR